MPQAQISEFKPDQPQAQTQTQTQVPAVMGVGQQPNNVAWVGDFKPDQPTAPPPPTALPPPGTPEMHDTIRDAWAQQTARERPYWQERQAQENEARRLGIEGGQLGIRGQRVAVESNEQKLSAQREAESLRKQIGEAMDSGNQDAVKKLTERYYLALGVLYPRYGRYGGATGKEHWPSAPMQPIIARAGLTFKPLSEYTAEESRRMGLEIDEDQNLKVRNVQAREQGVQNALARITDSRAKTYYDKRYKTVVSALSTKNGEIKALTSQTYIGDEGERLKKLAEAMMAQENLLRELDALPGEIYKSIVKGGPIEETSGNFRMSPEAKALFDTLVNYTREDEDGNPVLAFTPEQAMAIVKRRYPTGVQAGKAEPRRTAPVATCF